MSLYTYSLSTLRTEVVTRYDLPPSTTNTKPTTVQLTSLVNNSIRRFTNVLLTLLGDDYLTTMSVVSTTAGVATVNLPTRAFRVQAIGWIREPTNIIKLRRASVDDMLDGGSSPSNPRTWEAAPKYSLLGQTISFLPVPAAVYNLRVIYAQGFTPLAADGDTVEFGPGWDEWVINDVCAMIAKIREEDPAGYIEDRGACEQQIKSAQCERDESEDLFVRRRFDMDATGTPSFGSEGEYY